MTVSPQHSTASSDARIHTTEVEEKTRTNNNNSSSSHNTGNTFPDVCLRSCLQSGTATTGEGSSSSSISSASSEAANTTETSSISKPKENAVPVELPPLRRWYRKRTLSGGLPRRQIVEEDDSEEQDDVLFDKNSSAYFYTQTPPRRSANNRHPNDDDKERVWEETLLSTPLRGNMTNREHSSEPRTGGTTSSWRSPLAARFSPLAYAAVPRWNKNTKNQAVVRNNQQGATVHDSTTTTWLLPHQHPFKIFWDICTVLLSLVNAYATHVAIRDREFQNAPFIRFCEVWFVVDILLNFCVQRTTSDGTVVLRTFTAVTARYLTTWFVIDVLSLFPAELLWVQPVVEAQKRRGFFQKGFFRTKAVVRVTRWLRLQHVRYLQRVSQHTRRAAGIGAARLVRLLIRYAPKYLLFIRKTRGVLAMRLIRQFRWIRQMIRDFRRRRPTNQNKADTATCSLTDKDGNISGVGVADWEVLDDSDPF